jgi:Na+/melibiose symporter-like transporter
MSDILAIFGIFLLTALAFPAMMTTWWLLFPKLTDRAQHRIALTPWRTAFMGIAGAIGAAVPIAILMALPFGPAQFFGWLGIFMTITFATIGASGLAAHLGARAAERAGQPVSAVKSFLIGAVALELSAAFPILGWLVLLPATILFSLGASIFAVLRWQPRPKPQLQQNTGQMDARLEPQSA